MSAAYQAETARLRRVAKAGWLAALAAAVEADAWGEADAAAEQYDSFARLIEYQAVELGPAPADEALLAELRAAAGLRIASLEDAAAAGGGGGGDSDVSAGGVSVSEMRAVQACVEWVFTPAAGTTPFPIDVRARVERRAARDAQQQAAAERAVEQAMIATELGLAGAAAFDDEGDEDAAGDAADEDDEEGGLGGALGAAGDDDGLGGGRNGRGSSLGSNLGRLSLAPSGSSHYHHHLAVPATAAAAATLSRVSSLVASASSLGPGHARGGSFATSASSLGATGGAGGGGSGLASPAPPLSPAGAALALAAVDSPATELAYGHARDAAGATGPGLSRLVSYNAPAPVPAPAPHAWCASRSVAEGGPGVCPLPRPVLPFGCTGVTLVLEAVGLRARDRGDMRRVRVTVTAVADAAGRVDEPQQDVFAAATQQDDDAAAAAGGDGDVRLSLGGRAVHLQTPLEAMSDASCVALEVRHDKAKYISTKCWAFLDKAELLLGGPASATTAAAAATAGDSGDVTVTGSTPSSGNGNNSDNSGGGDDGLASQRVLCLELYKKPADYARRPGSLVPYAPAKGTRPALFLWVRVVLQRH